MCVPALGWALSTEVRKVLGVHNSSLLFASSFPGTMTPDTLCFCGKATLTIAS